jgi:hypothetical protein
MVTFSLISFPTNIFICTFRSCGILWESLLYFYFYCKFSLSSVACQSSLTWPSTQSIFQTADNTEPTVWYSNFYIMSVWWIESQNILTPNEAYIISRTHSNYSPSDSFGGYVKPWASNFSVESPAPSVRSSEMQFCVPLHIANRIHTYFLKDDIKICFIIQ